MKKKILKILAVTACAACVVGMAGCSSSDSGISLDSFWYVDSYAGIQNSAIGTEEVLIYDVAFTGGGNSSYYFDFDEAAQNSNYYKTTFGVALYDWDSQKYTIINSENKDEFKNKDGDYEAGENQEFVYYLKTELSYSGQYKYTETDEARDFGDYGVADNVNTISTITCFRSARNKLTPVYSESEVDVTSPNAYTATDVKNMCEHMNYKFTVCYNKNCSEATYSYRKLDHDSYTIESFDNKTASLSSDYTLFDNNEIYTAIRGMNLSSSFSETVSLFIPADGGITDVSVSCSSTGTIYENNADDETKDSIYNALTDTEAYGTSKTTDDDGNKVINYNIVEVTNAADTYSGVTQTAWYAAVENENDNQYRATMLYLAIPLSYDLGTFEYTLSSVDGVIAPDSNVNE